MKNPTEQELMEYVDGTLFPPRFREVEMLAAKSKQIQSEIALLQAIRRSVRSEAAATPSKHFTEQVMSELFPAKRDSLWYRIVKNSSNIFAMALVLSMVGIVLLSTPGGRKTEGNIDFKL